MSAAASAATPAPPPAPDDLRPLPEPMGLLITSEIRPRVTRAEYERLCELNDVLVLEWDPDGTLHIMAPASGGASRRNAELTYALMTWSKADGSGVVFDSSGGFTLPDGRVRSPDAAWVRREAWDALPAEQRRRGFPDLVPDFVAEIRSPGDAKPALRAKMGLYRDNGVRLGWLIDPVDGDVEVYRPGRPVERLQRPAALPGGDVLPGFVLDLKDILDG
jgi:Uma2 family endonuclease